MLVAHGDSAEAELGLALLADQPDRDLNGLRRLDQELVAISGLAHGRGGARDEDLVVVLGGLAHDLAQRGHGLAPLAPSDLAVASHGRPQLGHFDVVRHVAQEPVVAELGNQGVNGVAADVDRRQAHDRPTLNSFA